jgi:hypothetical protein
MRINHQPPAIVRKAQDELTRLARKINSEHQAGATAVRKGLDHYRTAGEKLLEARERVGRGFRSWIAENLEISRPQAYRYMKLAEVSRGETLGTDQLQEEWHRIEGHAKRDRAVPASVEEATAEDEDIVTDEEEAAADEGEAVDLNAEEEHAQPTNRSNGTTRLRLQTCPNESEDDPEDEPEEEPEEIAGHEDDKEEPDPSPHQDSKADGPEAAPQTAEDRLVAEFYEFCEPARLMFNKIEKAMKRGSKELRKRICSRLFMVATRSQSLFTKYNDLSDAWRAHYEKLDEWKEYYKKQAEAKEAEQAKTKEAEKS